MRKADHIDQHEDIQAEISKLQLLQAQAMIDGYVFMKIKQIPRKEKILDVFERDKMIFPENPIRDWRERKMHEIEKKYQELL